jgi:hypothetical protein
MTIRTYLRSGEVPALFGLDNSKSEWALWNDLRTNESKPAGEYGKWQARLMTQIMQGIAEDYKLKIEGFAEPHSTKDENILPPKSWKVAPSLSSNGHDALLVVTQRTESSLREWKEPFTIPAKDMMRFKSIAVAHEVDYIFVGMLVDGYSSKLFIVKTDEEEREKIKNRISCFIEDVKNGIEPDIDFGLDEVAVRKGAVVKKVEMSQETINNLAKERISLIAEKAPVDAAMKKIDARMREIDTMLIAVAGKETKIDAEKYLIVIERDSKNTPKVTIVDKAPPSLF